MSNKRVLWVIAAVVLGMLLLLVGTGVTVWKLARRATDQVLKPTEKTVDLSVLVTRVRELNRLETAAMRVMHVGRVSQSYKMVPDALAGDEITFLAAGDVIAGVDLSKLQPSDVWRSPDGTVNLRLPAAEILVTRVDNQESRVLSRNTGMLRRTDVDLETRARQHAETSIHDEALRKGILRMADDNAQKKLADFLRALGFERVRFVSARTPAGIPPPPTER